MKEIIMPDNSVHKFKEKLETTYDKFYINAFAEQVALIRELERVVGKEKAHKIVGEWSEKRVFNGIKAHLEGEGISISDFEEFKDHQKNMWESPRVKRTHTYSVGNTAPNSVTYIVTECIWAETLKALNAADLGNLMMCQTDFSSAKAYNPKITLTRTKTIMNGDECCDFTYTWVD
jgi:hypothetical protein